MTENIAFRDTGTVFVPEPVRKPAAGLDYAALMEDVRALARGEMIPGLRGQSPGLRRSFHDVINAVFDWIDESISEQAGEGALALLVATHELRDGEDFKAAFRTIIGWWEGSPDAGEITFRVTA